MTEEVRTTSSTGGQKGVKPARMGLLPVEALLEVATLYGKGAEKYDAHNWRRGYEWSKSYDAMMRHAMSFWNGEDHDPEMGTKHLASVVFHALTLMTFMDEQPDFDDRFVGTANFNLPTEPLDYWDTPEGEATGAAMDAARTMTQVFNLFGAASNGRESARESLKTLAAEYVDEGLADWELDLLGANEPPTVTVIYNGFIAGPEGTERVGQPVYIDPVTKGYRLYQGGDN